MRRVFMISAHALIILVGVTRVIQGVRGSNLLTAHSERKFGFAVPDPALYEPLERVSHRVHFGEVVCLGAQPSRYGAAWLHVMGTYFFSRGIVIVPRTSQELGALPCRRALITIRPGPRVLLWRAADGNRGP